MSAVTELADEVFGLLLVRFPIAATVLGLPGHHHRLTDYDRAAERRFHTSVTRLAARARAVPDEGLSRADRITAYREGWALYAERLADEMGLYSDDLARLGMLMMDSTRAGRLVVDTGLHAQGWSRQQAVDYLLANTPMALRHIVSEVDRYLVVPGQALAYLVGRLEIQRLRRRAESALGNRFDVRDFHEIVLGEGPVPLSLLDELVTEWIAARAG